MRKIMTLLVFVLGSMVPLLAQQDNGAQDNNQGQEMNGVICNADNVTQAGGKATCDESKNGTSDAWVFIGDDGTAIIIANPESLKGAHGKMSVRGEMRKVQNQNRMWIYNTKHIPSGM